MFRQAWKVEQLAWFIRALACEEICERLELSQSIRDKERRLRTKEANLIRTLMTRKQISLGNAPKIQDKTKCQAHD